MRDSSSPEPVLRFQTLFSRLTTLPVLDRKWEVLYLLYLLSGSSESPSVSRNIHDGTFPPFRNDGEGNGVNVIGLHNLPNRKRGNPSGGIGSRVPSGGQQTPVDPDDKRKSGAQMLEESGARLGQIGLFQSLGYQS